LRAAFAFGPSVQLLGVGINYTLTGDFTMLRWAVIFLIIALIAGALGMFGLEGTAMEAARILFFVFLVMFVVSMVMGRRGPIQ
jgi:uncharacterized membrane protein YtjA (UPF0391 family)